MKFEKLLEPGYIGRMELRNRMIQPAMGTNYSDSSGFVTERLINYISRRAEGGVGMIISEICLPDPSARVIPGELDLSDDIFIPKMARLVDAAHAGGAKICIQFAHGGCFAGKALTGKTPMTPSGIPTFQIDFEECRVMTVEEIHELAVNYGKAAKRAVQAGFDAVEIHGAHGYMPLQFLSPYTNRRTDEYGGSLENRARFPMEVIREVRKNVGSDFPLIYRLSAEEYTIPQGLTLDEACEFAKMIEKDVNAIHVSAGTWDSRYQYYEGIQNGTLNPDDYDTSMGVGAGTWIPPHFTPRGILIPLAEAVKKCVRLPIIAVNSISPELGEQALANGQADFIAIGRQSFADPDYPNKVMEQEPEKIRRCLRCNECHSSLVAPFGVQCSVNPQTGKEGEDFIKILPAERKKKVAVIGGGPGGMAAAIVAADRGHEVTLFEAKDHLGGALYYAAIPDFKHDFREYLNYLTNKIEGCAITVKLNTEANAKTIHDGKFEAVIAAMGAVPAKPPIKGLDDQVYTALDVLDGNVPKEEEIVVCGAGLVGCETAMFLAEMGKKVTIVDMVSVAAPDAAFYLKYNLRARLIELRVGQELNCEITGITKQGVIGERNGERVEIAGGAVVNALGMSGRCQMLDELRKSLHGINIIPVGDVNQPRKVLQAVHEGYHAGRRI